MFVKPATPDLLVANPEALAPMPRYLAPEGADVPDTEYWRRRIADGDVVLSRPDTQSKPRRAEKE